MKNKAFSLILIVTFWLSSWGGPAQALAPATRFSREQAWAWRSGFNPAIVSSAFRVLPRNTFLLGLGQLVNFDSLERHVGRLIDQEFPNFPDSYLREVFIDLSEDRLSLYADILHEMLHDLYFTEWIGVEGRLEFEELVRRHACSLGKLDGFSSVSKMIEEVDTVKRAIHYSEILTVLISVLYHELNLPVEKPANFKTITRWNDEVPIPQEIRAWLLEKKIFRPDLVRPQPWFPQPELFPSVRVLSSIGEAGSKEIEDLIKKNNAAERATVLGLATGSTPIPVYEALIAAFRRGLDLSRVITFNLDEYSGLPKGHPESYREYMFYNLFMPELHYDEIKNPRGIRLENIHILNGLAKTLDDLDETERQKLDKTFPKRKPEPILFSEEEKYILEERCREYDRAIEAAGGIDLQILGIGENGHVGFAEPGAPWDGETSVVKLTESTRRANARFFGSNVDAVPTEALSMGIGSILKARRILLFATGPKKAEIIQKTLFGPLTTEVPASALRRHPNVEFLLDEEAASKILEPSSKNLHLVAEPALEHWLQAWARFWEIPGKFQVLNYVETEKRSRGNLIFSNKVHILHSKPQHGSLEELIEWIRISCLKKL